MNNKTINRALKGDPDAAAACTAAGVVIPCPYCGEDAETRQHKNAIDQNDRPIGGWYVECEECDCGTSWHNTPEKALAVWNRRVKGED